MRNPFRIPRQRAESDATRERQQAEQHLADAQAQRSRVAAVADALRDIRARNHLADAVAETMRRRR